jgi:hypothetical protein
VSHAGNIPRLDVLRAFRVVDFDVPKAVMLLELVCETPTLQRVVMNALLTDTALSKEQQATLKQVMSYMKHSNRLDAFLASQVFVDMYHAASLLHLVYRTPSIEHKQMDLYDDLADALKEEEEATILQVVSLAGNFSNWQAILAMSVCDYDVNKATMLLALIQSQGSVPMIAALSNESWA